MSKRRREENLPPWALILIGIVLAAVFIWRAVPKHMIYLTTGIVVVIIGGVSYLVFKKHGIVPFKTTGRKIVEGLKTRPEETQRQGNIFPPLSESEKARLIDAVGNECENPNCHEQLGLTIHHIDPRCEKGPNKRNNLIVLCRKHHGLADKGEPSRALLRQWISRPKRFRY